MQPLFEENCLPVLNDVVDVFRQRGNEYSDTWRTCRWFAMIAAFKLAGIPVPDNEVLRTIAAGVFLDVKYERLGGPYKEDTPIDLLAYDANYVAQMRKLENRKHTPREVNLRGCPMPYPGDME
jgi:hypothetical protein